ncbi:MAG: tetratricopeptide repeat protein, partial [Terrimicrobiaceae bacterium]
MRALWLGIALAVPAVAADSRLEDGRQALNDGLPQVAIYKLRQAIGRKLPKEGQNAAELLLARALFAAGRFEESATLLEKQSAAGGEPKFWLAETYAALNKPSKALPLYQSLSQDERFATQAIVGAAKMLDALGRASEAANALSEFLEKNPSSSDAALELAEIRLEVRDGAGAIAALSSVGSFSPRQQQDAAFLNARALLESGEPAKAEEKLRTIKDPPARLAASVAVALAESRLQQKDAGEAEKIMESFVEENAPLPDLPAAFAALDRVYA